MKKSIALLSLLTVTLVLAGCSTPVALQGNYSVPGKTVTGTLNAATNGVTLGGSYATTNQVVGGSVTVGK